MVQGRGSDAGRQARAYYKDALRVRVAERDRKLDLEAVSWPNADSAPENWERDSTAGRLQRTIERGPRGAAAEDNPLAVPLRESILRFPSAPIHGVQRLHEYHNNLRASQNFHTYRILTAKTPSEPITRIFLFHNGLNELDRMGLYYQLASHLIERDKGVACILRPFPGHLTRAPFADFPENPLHRYLWDGSHLFRQFLRYMTETQWFLSALVRRSRYRCLSGAELLAENNDPDRSRLNPDILTDEMVRAWGRLSAASRAADKLVKGQGNATSMNSKPDRAAFRGAIVLLRDALKLQVRLDSELEDDGDLAEPSLHVVGYSLGGFAAQSIFMSWPFLIASCSTLLSGGPLRELSPTAFADPEEWQTVLHSLRYEIDEGMLKGRYGHRHGELAGLSEKLFMYFQRTFYEVFQQEYRGSFQNRLSAFRQRMLFIVGGDDPIVRARSVIDSAPAGGINLLEIGGIGHFLGSKSKGDEETQQRQFWLPELGKLIGRFSKQATCRYDAELKATWLTPDFDVPDRMSGEDPDEGSATVKRLSAQDLLGLAQGGALSSKLFELCLDDLLARQQEDRKGLLLILRNEVPAMLLDAKSVQHCARAFYHDDHNIVEYCRGIKRHWEALDESIHHACVVLPWNAKNIMLNMDPPSGFPSQSETAVGQIPREIKPTRTWSLCGKTFASLAARAPGSLMVFDGSAPLEPQQGMGRRAEELICGLGGGGEGLLRVPSLPDCWVWLSTDYLQIGDFDITEAIERFIYAAHARGDDEDCLSEHMHRDELRVITVSRARYNPRFRGRLLSDSRAVKQTLLHVALCLAVAYRYDEFDLETGKAREQRPRVGVSA